MHINKNWKNIMLPRLSSKQLKLVQWDQWTWRMNGVIHTSMMQTKKLSAKQGT